MKISFAIGTCSVVVGGISLREGYSYQSNKIFEQEELDGPMISNRLMNSNRLTNSNRLMNSNRLLDSTGQMDSAGPIDSTSLINSKRSTRLTKLPAGLPALPPIGEILEKNADKAYVKVGPTNVHESMRLVHKMHPGGWPL